MISTGFALPFLYILFSVMVAQRSRNSCVPQGKNLRISTPSEQISNGQTCTHLAVIRMERGVLHGLLHAC